MKDGIPDFLYIPSIAEIYPGSIYVEQNFHHSGGSISIEGSSGYKGGAVLESSSGVARDLLTICKSKSCSFMILGLCYVEL